MARQLERNFKKKVVALLKALPNTDGFVKEAGAIRGLLDTYWCINGYFVALELKKNEAESRKNDARTKLQWQTIHKIRAAGGYAEMVYPENWDVIYTTLSAIAEPPPVARPIILR